MTPYRLIKFLTKTAIKNVGKVKKIAQMLVDF